MTITTILTVGGWIMAGAIAIFGIFTNQRQKMRAYDDQVATNLINNLKATADQQAKEITALRAREVDQGKEIAHLQGQIKILTEIFQGRDPLQAEVFKQSPSHFEIAKENNRLCKETSEELKNLIKAITEFGKKLTEVVPALKSEGMIRG